MGTPTPSSRGADGQLHGLINEHAQGTSKRFKIKPVIDKLPGVRQLEVGRFGDDPSASLVWIDRGGDLRRARLRIEPGGQIRLEPSSFLLKAKPDERLAIGRFRGEKTADLILGRRLLVAGDPANEVDLPNLPTPRTDPGRPPLVGGGSRREWPGRPRPPAFHTRLGHGHGTRRTGPLRLGRWRDQSQGFLCSDGDGLLDTWKTGAVRPGGLDLPALGCKPGRKDLILEIERFENVDIKLLRRGGNHRP